MQILHELTSLFTNTDNNIIALANAHGPWIYLFLFVIIFCETGLVVTPFLPGDVLIFTLGSLSTTQLSSPLNFWILLPLLLVASITGNQVNYFIGRLIGTKILSLNKPWLFSKEKFMETHHFYEKHGGKAIVFGRFIPIVRTFIPFVAGIARMSIKRFAFFNIISAFLWIGGLMTAGFFLGSIPIVKKHFSIALYTIIVLSSLPIFLSSIFHKPNKKHN